MINSGEIRAAIIDGIIETTRTSASVIIDTKTFVDRLIISGTFEMK